MTFNKKIILDCDPGEDDALAILLAFARGLDMRALVCGFGNSSAEKTYKNGAGLLKLANKEGVALFKGVEKPYRPHPLETSVVTAGDFVGENGLCGVALPFNSHMLSMNQMEQGQRIKNLAQHIRDSEPLNYLITGPCSTFAHILDELGDDAPKYIEQVIVMGGALDAMGNHGPLNPETGKSYAEFNFYCDPHGVDRVLKSGLKVTIVPWDLTEQIVLTYRELARFQSLTPQGDFVLKLVKNFLESYGNANDRSFEFNDCITISALQGCGSLKSEFIRITLEGEQAGRIVRDRNNGAELSFFNLDLDKITSVRNGILHDVGCNLDYKG